MIPLYLYYRIKKEKEHKAAVMTEQEDLEDDYVAPMRPSLFKGFRAFAGALGRTAASAGSLLADSDLRG